MREELRAENSVPRVRRTSRFADIIAAQRSYFAGGMTRPPVFREEQLRRLKQAVKDNESQLTEALAEDLGKSAAESYLTEVFLIIHEINHALRKLKRWVRPERVKTDLIQLPASSYRVAEPLGVVLIISPWNYPAQLSLMPLAGAIAAGNCAVVKPSELSPKSSEVIARIIGDTFPEDYVTTVQGGPETAQELLQNRFDHVFFTGSGRIGRMVLRSAAEHLTPVTLELGGKSPAIVDRTANIPLAAKRIGFSRFINAGQTCVSPDYVLVQSSVKQRFTDALIAQLREWWGDAVEPLPNFSWIVDDRHFGRLSSLIESARAEGGRVLYGGTSEPVERYIAPTIIDGIKPESVLMEEEIFGPILPIIEYDTVEEAFEQVRSRPKPLAAYLFSNNRAAQRNFVSEIPAGGVCLNDCLSHMTTAALPFGGVGESGMGAYHGKESFHTFSHRKSVMKKANWLELPVRYPPYEKRRWLFRILRTFFG